MQDQDNDSDSADEPIDLRDQVAAESSAEALPSPTTTSAAAPTEVSESTPHESPRPSQPYGAELTQVSSR